MDRLQTISEFCRLARLNGKRSRRERRDGNLMDAQWFQGRAGAYLTAARILKAKASDAHIRRITVLAGRVR